MSRLIPYAMAERLRKFGGHRQLSAGVSLEDTSLGSGIALVKGDMVREDVRVFELSAHLLFWKLRVGVQVRTNPRKE